MREIIITGGHAAFVDDEDYELVCQFKWRRHPMGYAMTNLPRSQGHKGILMHRLITGFPQGMDVDHRNKNKLDNRRENLRVCEHHKNRCNTKKPSSNTSGFVGVDFLRRRGKWRARVSVKNKSIQLGEFHSRDDAIIARKNGVQKYYGEYASVE